MASLLNYLINNPNKSSIQPPTKSVVTSSPSSTTPILKKTPAVETFLKTQSPQPTTPIDNTEKITDIKSQISDLQAQEKGLKDYGFTDTNQLEKVNGNYVPSAYETAKSDYMKAYQDYINTLNPSQEYIESQNKYNDYVANQSKSIAGLEGQGRGIPLSIVRGQQEKLLRQTQPEAQRLQNKIGIQQKSQEMRSGVGLANVSLREKLLGLQQSPAERAKAERDLLKGNLDIEKTRADIAKTQRQTENIGKMTEYQREQLNKGKTVKSGGLVIPEQSISLGQQKLDESRGSDNYTDSGLYLEMLKAWKLDGGLEQDFFNEYPPKNYLNPNDSSIPKYIRDKLKVVENDIDSLINSLSE